MLSILFIFADNIFKIGLSTEEGIHIFLVPFCIFWSWIIVHTALRKDFFNRFIINKENIHLALCLPIVVAIIMEFTLNIVRLIPFWLGHDVISPGSNQVTNLKGFTENGLIFSVSVISPFSEEFLFRYLPFGGIFLGIVDMEKRYKWIKRIHEELVINKNPKYIWFWIILTNIGFAMAHGPDLLSFPLYFIPGIVFSLFFFRYGFLSAWLAHGASNFFSGIAFDIIVNTLNYVR
jgi:hypothetical protein